MSLYKSVELFDRQMKDFLYLLSHGWDAMLLLIPRTKTTLIGQKICCFAIGGLWIIKKEIM